MTGQLTNYVMSQVVITLLHVSSGIWQFLYSNWET